MLWSLSHIRNVQTHSFIHRKNKSCSFEAELLHNVGRFTKEMTTTIHFLNVQAYYLDNASERILDNYNA